MGLAIVHAAVIAGFEKEVNGFPVHMFVYVVIGCTRESQCLSLASLMT